MSQATIEQTFDVSGQARLRVDNIRGTVQIQAGKEGEIRVVAIKHSDNGNSEHTQVTMEQDASGLVTVKTHYGEAGWRISGKPCRVDYAITTPQACDVKLSCVSSNAAISGLRGTLMLKTVSGNLSLTDLSGKLEVHTVSGDVSGVSVAAPVELKSVSADVNFKESDLPSIEASTVSGDLQFETAVGNGPYRMNSVSGDAQLIVPADTGCEIDMHSFSGNLDINLSSTYHHHSRKTRQVTVQQGGTNIYFHSLSGNFSLRAPGVRGSTEKNVKQAPIEKQEPVDRMSILDRIERGELSVDEGVGLLEEA